MTGKRNWDASLMCSVTPSGGEGTTGAPSGVPLQPYKCSALKSCENLGLIRRAIDGTLVWGDPAAPASVGGAGLALAEKPLWTGG
eukprot:3099561-Pyramimonas_sp.AAC.1